MAIVTSNDPAPADQPAQTVERRALGVACGAHVLHDGYTDLIWLALPIWQAEFGLSYAAVGFLRTIFSGTMAVLQIPSTLVADRVGGALVLAIGTALAGLCYVLAGLSDGFAWLLAALLLGGLGASTQHPLASALVTRAYAGARSLTALRHLQFRRRHRQDGPAGGRQCASPFHAMASGLCAAGSPRHRRRRRDLSAHSEIFPEPAAAAQPADESAGRGAFKPGYFLLLAMGAIDSLTRAGFLVFLPFLLIGKGASVTTAGFALTLVFIGGATGKLACAWISARFGVIGTICITEGLTGVGMLGVLWLPLEASLVLLPLFGIVLNGTSTAIYGSVPQFATPDGRNRAFSWFYTGTLSAGAFAPTLSGLSGDLIGVHATIVLVALLVLVTLPLAAWLRPAMAAVRAA